MCAVEVATRGVRRARTAHPRKRRQAARTRDGKPPRRRGTAHTTIAYNGILQYLVLTRRFAPPSHTHTPWTEPARARGTLRFTPPVRGI